MLLVKQVEFVLLHLKVVGWEECCGGNTDGPVHCAQVEGHQHAVSRDNTATQETPAQHGFDTIRNLREK